jgi:hypothetical protein
MEKELKPQVFKIFPQFFLMNTQYTNTSRFIQKMSRKRFEHFLGIFEDFRWTKVQKARNGMQNSKKQAETKKLQEKDVQAQGKWIRIIQTPQGRWIDPLLSKP